MKDLLVRPFREWNSRRLNRTISPVVVLLYHRVADLDHDPQLLAVSPAHFREQLCYLKDHFPVLRLEEDWGEVSEPSIVITFDDGYADNLTEALPILQAMDLPATFFVSTGYLNGCREFWWDELERLLDADIANWPARVSFDPWHDAVWPTATVHQREKLYRFLVKQVKLLDVPERERILQELAAQFPSEAGGRWSHRSLSTDELVAMANDRRVTIGAHTVHHVALSCLDEDRQREEILGSRHALEELLGQKITVFSYPYGARNDFDDRSVNICREAGFVKAVANFAGQVRPWTDAYRLPRQLIRNWSLPIFSCKIEQFWFRS